MFSSSSQMKYWIYSCSSEIKRLRCESNQKFIKTHGKHKSSEERESFFLSPDEERAVCRYYEYKIKDFCGKFHPPMPVYVVGTSLAFFKRFYLNNSVMDYHPNEIMCTCVYLACKVEEFNVSILQFVGNLHGDREKYADIIIAHELFLMQQLHYHLTVHNPFRPVEGLMIDLKTRCPGIKDTDKLRKGADDFLDRSMDSDVAMMFAPSQIALASLVSSASKCEIVIDSYVKDTLLASESKENIIKTVDHIQKIRSMVKNIDPVDRSRVRFLLQKLDSCRNQENNPDSEIYQEKLRELFEEEDDRRQIRRDRIAAEEGDMDSEMQFI